MLNNNMRLVVKGNKGTFTDRGGIMDPTKICFPVRSLTSVIDDFGFIKDFRVVSDKDKYSFFAANKVNSSFPSYKEVLDYMTTTKDYESLFMTDFNMDEDDPYYDAEYKTIRDLADIKAVRYKDYIIIHLSINHQSILSYYYTILTRDMDNDGSLLSYTINKSPDEVYDNKYLKHESNFTLSDRIYKEIDKLFSSIYSEELKNETCYCVNDRIVDYICSNDDLVSERDLMYMFSTYKDSAKIFNSDKGCILIHNFNICDKFMVDLYSYTINDGMLPETKSINLICLLFRINNMNLSFAFYVNPYKDYDKVKKWMDVIGTSKLNSLFIKMKDNRSYPSPYNNLHFINQEDEDYYHLRNAIDLNYLCFIMIDDTNSSFLRETYYENKVGLLRWNALSDYKEYYDYERIDSILKEQEKKKSIDLNKIYSI